MNIKKILLSTIAISTLLTSMPIFADVETEISHEIIPIDTSIEVIEPEGVNWDCGINNSARYMPNGGFGNSVTGVSSGSSLNIRSSAGVSSSVIGSLPNGADVTTSYYRGPYLDGQWWRYICTYEAHGGHVHGYVSEKYLSGTTHIHHASNPYGDKCTSSGC